jgi:hypothetical protein
MGILRKFKKIGEIIIGTDNKLIDSPEWNIGTVRIDTIIEKLHVEILHKVMQGTVEQPEQRDFNINFSDLPSSVKVTGKAFLDAIEEEVLKHPNYADSTEQ